MRKRKRKAAGRQRDHHDLSAIGPYHSDLEGINFWCFLENSTNGTMWCTPVCLVGAAARSGAATEGERGGYAAGRYPFGVGATATAAAGAEPRERHRKRTE
jgi:hypothetical protein